MEVTRRGWLGLAGAAGALATSAPLRAQSAVPGKYGAAVDRVRAFAQADLAAKGFPGMVLALVAPDGFSHSTAVGLANVDTRQPASPDQLFQIGSLTKSLTAMALFALADRGKLDLDARAADYLPDHPLPPEPITLRHLLEHSSGLPNSLGDDPFPDVPGERLWTGFAPGSRYSYCNLGYNLLGAVIERASAMPYFAALTALVLRPLGMTGAVPTFRTADRARYAAGHSRFRDDLPWLRGAKLAPGRWYEFENAAGSVAATTADMVRYLRFLAGVAQGKGAPLFSDAFAMRFGQATIDMPGRKPGPRYGNGLVTHDVDGGACFNHTGGVVGFSTAFNLDRATGVGAYASVNVGGAGNYRPTEVTEYAVSLLRAAHAGRPLPAERGPAPPARIEDQARYVGRWVGPAGAALDISERGGALFVTAAGRTRPLAAYGRVLVTDHPALSPYGLAFDQTRPLLRLGDRLFGRDAAPPQPAPVSRLAALAGSYASSSSWTPRRTVFALGEQLFLGLDEVREAPDGSWRYVDEGGASERIWFQHFVGRRPQRLNVSGIPYARTGSG